MYAPSHFEANELDTPKYMANCEFPASCREYWKQHFGFIMAHTGRPVVIGETGGRNAGHGSKEWQDDLLDWAISSKIGVIYFALASSSPASLRIRDQPHPHPAQPATSPVSAIAPPPHPPKRCASPLAVSLTRRAFSSCSQNPNSKDAGGLLLDDWTTPDAGKLQLLSGVPSTSLASVVEEGDLHTSATRPSSVVTRAVGGSGGGGCQWDGHVVDLAPDSCFSLKGPEECGRSFSTAKGPQTRRSFPVLCQWVDMLGCTGKETAPCPPAPPPASAVATPHPPPAASPTASLTHPPVAARLPAALLLRAIPRPPPAASPVPSRAMKPLGAPPPPTPEAMKPLVVPSPPAPELTPLLHAQHPTHTSKDKRPPFPPSPSRLTSPSPPFENSARQTAAFASTVGLLLIVLLLCLLLYVGRIISRVWKRPNRWEAIQLALAHECVSCHSSLRNILSSRAQGGAFAKVSTMDDGDFCDSGALMGESGGGGNFGEAESEAGLLCGNGSAVDEDAAIGASPAALPKLAAAPFEPSRASKISRPGRPRKPPDATQSIIPTPEATTGTAVARQSPGASLASDESRSSNGEASSAVASFAIKPPPPPQQPAATTAVGIKPSPPPRQPAATTAVGIKPSPPPRQPAATTAVGSLPVEEVEESILVVQVIVPTSLAAGGEDDDESAGALAGELEVEIDHIRTMLELRTAVRKALSDSPLASAMPQREPPNLWFRHGSQPSRLANLSTDLETVLSADRVWLAPSHRSIPKRHEAPHEYAQRSMTMRSQMFNSTLPGASVASGPGAGARKSGGPSSSPRQPVHRTTRNDWVAWD